MKRVLFLILCGISNCCLALAPDTRFDGNERVYAALLLSDSTMDISAAAKSMVRGGESSRELQDLAAEVMQEQLLRHPILDANADTIAWLAKALAVSRSQRYRRAIEQLLDPKFEHAKLRKYGALALAELLQADEQEFAPQAGLLDALRARATADRVTDADARARYFEIEPGDSLNTVLETLGWPDRIATGGAKTINLVYGRVRTTGLSLHYADYGVLYLSAKRAHAEEWLVEQVSNAYLLTREVADEAERKQVEMLLSDDWLGTIAAISEWRRSREPCSLLVCDVAAERLLRSMATRADYEEKLLAVLAYYVAQSEDLRYEQVLTTLSETAGTRAVRRHAKSALKILREKNRGAVQQHYRAGMLNIGKLLNTRIGSPVGRA